MDKKEIYDWVIKYNNTNNIKENIFTIDDIVNIISFIEDEKNKSLDKYYENLNKIANQDEFETKCTISTNLTEKEIKEKYSNF